MTDLVYDRPDVDPLRVLRLTPGQIQRLLRLADLEWAALDEERRACSPRESQSLLERQQELETIQNTLKKAL